MTISEGVPTISELRGETRAVTFFRPKGGGGTIFFFAYTIDMQYFKGRLFSAFSVPLMKELEERTFLDKM